MHHDSVLAESVDLAHITSDTTLRYAHARVTADITVNVTVAPWRRYGAGEVIVTQVPVRVRVRVRVRMTPHWQG